jgi:hypothetical protein
MTIKAGVWIDHHKAVVVLITEQGEDMLQILPDQGPAARSAAGLRPKNAYTQSGFVGEGMRVHSVTMQLNEFYDGVIACLREAQAILILGPDEAKGEFRRRITSQKFSGHIAEMKTAAKLTDQQISDYVRQHFL